jgi:hypothetical protein
MNSTKYLTMETKNTKYLSIKLIIEMYYEGDCIQQCIYEEGEYPKFLPNIGDKLRIKFEDEEYNNEENYRVWEVEDKLFLYPTNQFDRFSNIQFYIKPCGVEESEKLFW